MPDEHSGHQHDHEPVHDQGQGHAGRGSGHAGSKADENQGGGRREHRAGGSHSGGHGGSGHN